MKNRHLLIMLVFLFAIPSLLRAQDAIIDDEERPQAEFDVSINPMNDDNIIVATMHGFSEITESFLSVYYTIDGGDTWAKSDIDGNFDIYDGSGDPVIEFDADGNAYLVNLGIDADDFLISTILSKSTDMGETWEPIATYDQETDKPWMAIDNSNESPHKGNIYIPVVTDDGLSLLTYDQEGELLHTAPINQGDQLPSVVVARDGDVIVSTVGLANPNEINVIRYINGGAQVADNSIIVTFPDFTFNAADISGRFQPTVYLSMDQSGGAFDGRMYVTYTASESMDNTKFDVFIKWSDDKGATWFDAKRVHEDVREGYQQFYSSSFVNDNGVLMIDWYDRGAFPEGSANTDFVVGVSHDGGETIEQMTANTLPMDFGPMLLDNFGFGVGEYHQCVASESTGFTFWADGRTNDGDINIFFAKVDLGNPSTGIEESGLINSPVAVTKMFPLPARQYVQLEMNLKSPQELYMQIISMSGNVMLTTPTKQYSSGIEKDRIEFNLAAGVYYLSVYNTEGLLCTKKLIVE